MRIWQRQKIIWNTVMGVLSLRLNIYRVIDNAILAAWLAANSSKSMKFLSPPVQLAWWAHMHHFVYVCLTLCLSGFVRPTLCTTVWVQDYIVHHRAGRSPTFQSWKWKMKIDGHFRLPYQPWWCTMWCCQTVHLWEKNLTRIKFLSQKIKWLYSKKIVSTQHKCLCWNQSRT